MSGLRAAFFISFLYRCGYRSKLAPLRINRLID